MKTPNVIHQRSLKEYSSKITNYDYPFHYKKIKVSKNGAARWGAYHWIFVAGGAATRYVGVQEIDNGIWNVYYRNVLLGYFDEKLFRDKEQYLKLNKHYQTLTNLKV